MAALLILSAPCCSQIHQWKRRWAIATNEIDLVGGVLADFLHRLNGFELHVGRTIARDDFSFIR